MIRVPARFSGPIGYANGGWIGGLLAAESDLDPAMVTLRKPVPLETDLHFDGANLTLADTVLAEVTTADFNYPIPEPITRAEAEAAQAQSPVQASENYGTCLVCGVERTDGFQLRPGPVAGRPHTVACIWQPGRTQPPLPADAAIAAVWAALDCPGAWTQELLIQPMLLGRMMVSILDIPDLTPGANDDYIVIGHAEGAQGRKVFTTTALYDAEQNLLAHAEATWITVDAHPRSRDS